MLDLKTVGTRQKIQTNSEVERNLEDEVLTLYRHGGNYMDIITKIYQLRELRKLLPADESSGSARRKPH